MRGAPDPAASPWLPPLVRDLRNHAGHSLVLAGEFVPDSVWEGARLLNELGNVGATVTYPAGGSHFSARTPRPSLRTRCLSGGIDAVFLLDCNPSTPRRGFLAPRFSAKFRLCTTDSCGRNRSAVAGTCQNCMSSRAGATRLLSTEHQTSFSRSSSRSTWYFPHVLAAALLTEWPANDYDIVRSYWREILTGDDFESLWPGGA